MIKSPKPLRVPDFHTRKQQGLKITMLTAYDAWLARLLAESGAVDMLLVGDSLGMVQLGFDTTVPVTMADMVRHTSAVRRGAPDSFLVADLPFLAAQINPDEALRNAGRLMRSGANAVKLEGGFPVISVVERMVAAGIPVMGHLGLRPQSVHALGGFRRQAKTPPQQQQVIEEGLALQAAGAFSLVLEFVPDELGRDLTNALSISVIGIGAGPDCDGQVLVTHDILGLTGQHAPSFARRYAAGGRNVIAAVQAFSTDVHGGVFPAPLGEQTLTVVESVSDLRAQVGKARRAGHSIGLVPTMGALHAGHARLLAEARRQNDFLAASVFVNPLQFDRPEDLEKYPRTWEADLALFRQHGVDLVFAPKVHDLYPGQQLTFAESPSLSRYLDGEHRPGHFRGVATVVLKLFNLVQPDRAYFGEKDAQQLAIVRRMVQDFNLSVAVVPVATAREADGLAMSSRNKHLSAEQRAVAPVLYRALQRAVQLLDNGESLVSAMRPVVERLFQEQPGIRLEYVEWVDPETLVPVKEVNGVVLIAAAIWLGDTRLIDNLSWPTP